MPHVQASALFCCVGSATAAWLLPACAASAHSLDIQTPGPLVRLSAGISGQLSLRDLLLSKKPGVSGFAGVAHYGLAASVWTSRHGSRSASEALLSYSYSLPLVDAHIGYSYVDLSDPLGVRGGGLSIGLTSNVSEDTEAEVFHNRAKDDRYRTLSGRITHRVFARQNTALDVKISGSRWIFPAASARGTTLSLLLSHQLAAGLEARIALDRVRSSGSPLLPTGSGNAISVLLTKSF